MTQLCHKSLIWTLIIIIIFNYETGSISERVTNVLIKNTLFFYKHMGNST